MGPTGYAWLNIWSTMVYQYKPRIDWRSQHIAVKAHTKFKNVDGPTFEEKLNSGAYEGYQRRTIRNIAGVETSSGRAQGRISRTTFEWNASKAISELQTANKAWCDAERPCSLPYFEGSARSTAAIRWREYTKRMDRSIQLAMGLQYFWNPKERSRDRKVPKTRLMSPKRKFEDSHSLGNWIPLCE